MGETPTKRMKTVVSFPLVLATGESLCSAHPEAVSRAPCGQKSTAGSHDTCTVSKSWFGRKCTGWGFFILSWYILAILGGNVLAGGLLFSVGTFWQFRVEMYWLGIFYSQSVHFGHFATFKGLEETSMI